MEDCQSLGQNRLAIFYGKQAVNVVQSVRADISGLKSELRRSYLTTKEENYRTLAELLITEGRLPEAEEILNLLKEQEYRELVRGDTSPSGRADPDSPKKRNGRSDIGRSAAIWSRWGPAPNSFVCGNTGRPRKKKN